MASGIIKTGEINMFYELTGPREAPVVCLNHCFASDHHYWDLHMAAFDGFQILRYDTRGHGHSDAPVGPYTLEMLAADVAGLCDALGIAKVHFCGVSLGGQIAQTFALEYPQKLASLTLVNSTCEYTDAQTEMWRERARTAIDNGITAIQAPLLKRWFTSAAAENQIPGYLYMAEAISRFTPASFDAASAAMCALDTTDRLSTIQVPAMVIATPDDPGAPREVSEKMARLIPDCQLHWLEPGQHLASLEHPERFNTLMRNFLLGLA